MNKIDTIMLIGPTASGKTSLAVDISTKINGEIVACDSMQIYKELNIGTGKPSEDEIRLSPHHMIDIVSIRDSFTVADYHTLAIKEIRDINLRKNIPIVCGGTGLYINSLLYEMDFLSNSKEVNLREELEKKSNEDLVNMLFEYDKDIFNKVDIKNRRRLIRAIENFKDNSKVGEFKNLKKPHPLINPIIIYLDVNRENLYDKINKRVDKFIESGLVEEVKSIMNSSIARDLQGLKAIGYKEIIGYLNNEYSLNEAIELIKRNTRRYAKRQITWFKRYDNLNVFNVDEYKNKEELSGDIIKWLRKRI